MSGESASVADFPRGAFGAMYRMSKWIDFWPRGASKSGKTRIWEVEAREGAQRLGVVSWYAPWRCYAFTPEPGTVFEHDCLGDIARFCEAATREHRALARDRAQAKAVARDG